MYRRPYVHTLHYTVYIPGLRGQGLRLTSHRPPNGLLPGLCRPGEGGVRIREGVRGEGGREGERGGG